jgi:hypothetical protein
MPLLVIRSLDPKGTGQERWMCRPPVTWDHLGVSCWHGTT